MQKLSCKFDIEEQRIIELWRDSELVILEKIEEGICFLLNFYGSLTYEECFGKIDSEYLSYQRYLPATPIKVIKYYRFYLLENQGEQGDWYVGEKHPNGNIEFYKCCESLEYAFDSL